MLVDWSIVLLRMRLGLLRSGDVGACLGRGGEIFGGRGSRMGEGIEEGLGDETEEYGVL
jgi:hypothetical protein